MPIAVKHTITANDLRVGDQPLGEPAIIAVERKQVNVVITFNGGRTMRARKTDAVIVMRDEPTTEEREALRREYMTHTLRRDLMKWLTGNPLTVVDDITTKFRENEYDGELFNWSNLADVLQKQAMYKQALAIRHRIADQDARNVAIVDDDALLDAFASWYHANTDDRRSPRSPLSRSTSQLSNLIEDMDTWAVATVKQTIVWADATDEIERRVAAAKAVKKQN